MLKHGIGADRVKIGDTDYIYMLMGSNTASFYRYNTMGTTNPWDKKADAPLGLSGKVFKHGSAISASADGQYVYVLKAATTSSTSTT